MDRKLSKDEMDTLLNSPAPGDGSDSGNVVTQGEASKVSVYNFRRPDRFPKAALQSLQVLHDRFCTSAAASISTYFRTPAEMSVLWIEQANFSEFLNSLPDPTCVNAISLRPLQGLAVLEIGPDVAFPLIDRLLGGTGGAPTDPDRKLTDIEKNVIRGFVNLLASDLSEAWRPITEINFHVHSSETRPQLLQVAAPNEVVLSVAVELRMGELRGRMHLCLPFSALEPILGKFEQGAAVERKEDRSDLVKVLRCLLRAPVNVGCELLPTMVTVNDLMNLTAGDIMRLDNRLEDRVRIIVGGASAFEASLMEIDGRKGVGVISRITG
jgi:flagellar motor switch protein FliM